MEQRSNIADHAESMSLHRALDILELLTRATVPVGLTEIARRSSGPKATVHRLLATLQTRGYVTQDPQTGAYTAGVRCFELGSSWAQNLDLRTTAAPVLADLNSRTQETVHLAIYDEGEIVYVDKLESPRPVVARSHVGRRCPAFCVATGRALLAFQPHQEVAQVLRRPLPVFTARTITDPAELGDLLEQVRATGYAVNHESYREGVGGVAAPIRDHTGAVVASVGCCVPEHRFGPDRFGLLREQTVLAAGRISRRLGAAVTRRDLAADAQQGAQNMPARDADTH
jgi:DNA-binding IclR family transcriptional regulator